MIEVQDLGYWRIKALILVGGQKFLNLISEYMRRGARIKELEDGVMKREARVHELRESNNKGNARVIELFGIIAMKDKQIAELEEQLKGVQNPFVGRMVKERN